MLFKQKNNGKNTCCFPVLHRAIIKKLLIISAVALFAMLLFIFLINLYVTMTVADSIYEPTSSDYDCIIVLGAGVRNGSPSPMLKDRLDTAIDLYKQGKANKLLMSGDHGRTEYDEVNIMKSYAIENGVPSEDVFMDHAGFSTYESIYRARDVFQVKKAIVVTQKYHLFRALYICQSLGIDAVGVNSDPRYYTNAQYREFREVLARNKDFFYCIFKPLPKYLGDAIEVSGNGNITND